MTPPDIRQSVQTLQQQNVSLREIARVLKISRNTVRAILREPQSPVAGTAAPDEGGASAWQRCMPGPRETRCA